MMSSGMSDSFKRIYSYLVMGVYKKKFLMSMVSIFAPGVEITLLINNLLLSMLAVGVPKSNG